MPDKRLTIGILILLVVNLLQAFFTPISEDEAYYWLWSQHLDWGYFDHPPMVAWWISVGSTIIHHELGVRLLTILFNGFSVFLLWKILRPETSKQFQLFGIILGSTLVFQIFGFLTTPDAPLLFFTILYLFSLKKSLEKNSYFHTTLLAISFAGLMYSKYHGILVILFTLLPIWKIWWKNTKIYFAVLGSLVLYIPHILWLFEHDFVPIRYHFLERSSDETFEIRKLTNYLGIYFLGCAPFLSYFIIQSIYRFKSENPFRKSIWWLSILPGIFFFLSIFKDNVQPQWLLISFIAMALLLYWNYSEKIETVHETQDARNETQDKSTENSSLRTQNSKLRWLLGLSVAGISLVLIARILLIIPSISPLFKNQSFGNQLKTSSIPYAVFEKYQEASVYKFHNPQRKVAVHRTLGNRKSQFDLWNWEEDFYGKTVAYISPWIKSGQSFKGYKNRDYYVKEIPNYLTYQLVEIETEEEISAKPGQIIQLKIKLKNFHGHPLRIGKNSKLKLNVSYYEDLQYEIVHSYGIETEDFELLPNEEKDLKISFKNSSERGDFKACVGINYSEIGTTYLSKPIRISVR